MIDGSKLPYADTRVSVERSKEKINDLLKEWGTSGIQWTWINNREVLRFIHEYEFEGVKHSVAYEIEIPEMGLKRGRGYDKRLERNDRQAYRVVLHVLKNRFVAIASGMKSFENEFLSDIIYRLPDGRTRKMGDLILGQLSKTKPVDLLEE